MFRNIIPAFLTTKNPVLMYYGILLYNVVYLAYDINRICSYIRNFSKSILKKICLI